MKDIRYCEICRADIKLKKDRIKLNSGKYTEMTYSDEGVYFNEGNVWFCNNCYNEMVGDLFNSEFKK